MSALLTLIYREYCRACLAEMQTAAFGWLKLADQGRPFIDA
jgi:hypothetical protein